MKTVSPIDGEEALCGLNWEISCVLEMIDYFNRGLRVCQRL